MREVIYPNGIPESWCVQFMSPLERKYYELLLACDEGDTPLEDRLTEELVQAEWDEKVFIDVVANLVEEEYMFHTPPREENKDRLVRRSLRELVRRSRPADREDQFFYNLSPFYIRIWLSHLDKEYLTYVMGLALEPENYSINLLSPLHHIVARDGTSKMYKLGESFQDPEMWARMIKRQIVRYSSRRELTETPEKIFLMSQGVTFYDFSFLDRWRLRLNDYYPRKQLALPS